ncbi:MAG: hypothetical protein Ct9H90mP11_07340 [Acidimicrobiales bacterium]|jgi:hypothetical protein|nr:hypothetical protein [Actinomycetota bacterium]GIS39414.1 MAG: hypothetical protein Ct9H90mP11_07340 [Acidimicrobiales bacterium]|tara:strand:- start:4503 stop:4832 length:330 start_codon:yes stop_codon:yes gene_type:complete
MRYLLMSLADLDDEILERLPTDIRGAIKNGTLKVLPKDIVDSLPDQVSDSIPKSLIEAANANPVLTLVLVICGVIGIIGFLFGVFKSGLKTALFFGAVAAISWGYFAVI